MSFIGEELQAAGWDPTILFVYVSPELWGLASFSLVVCYRGLINELQADAARAQEENSSLQMKLEEAEEEKKELWIANARAHAAVVMSVNASPVAHDPRERQVCRKRAASQGRLR